MQIELNPLAVQNAAVLRRLAEARPGQYPTMKALADALGRDKSNFAKTIAALQAADLIQPEPLSRVERADGDPLTVTGRDQLAAIDRAEDPAAAGPLTARHADLEPHPLNPRKDFDSEDARQALDDLRVSIVKKGILQPILVRPREDAPGKWWIIAGERRWRAVGAAIFDGDWEEDRPLPITARAVDDAEHLELSLLENIQRADMLPIEEAVGIGQAIRDFGADTASLADKLGKSQRWVQLRLQLLDLSPEDQDRMRLAKGHPDRLGFKAALALVQTPRPPVPAASETTDEPGSPPTRDPSFDDRITDREALILVEVADKAARDPDPDYGSEHYTGVLSADAMTQAQSLITKGLIGFRQRGATVLVRPRLFSTGYGDWLTGLGFDQHRADCLFEARAKVHGADVARQLAEDGRYATRWLNPVEPGAQADADPAYVRPRNTGLAIPSLPTPDAVEQPELIEATAEEREAIRRQEAERLHAEQARQIVDAFAYQVKAWAILERSAGRADYLGRPAPNATLDEDIDDLFEALAMGEFVEAGAILAGLQHRASIPWIKGQLRGHPLPDVYTVMLNARSRALEEPDAADADDEGYSFATDPDPSDDAGLTDEDLECADSPVDAQPEGVAETRTPAVPIRKSITPDFIVCLEDGRKFKSLKRHLRTRYDLSPEQYRARWGLPADYPLVAPNYAKARAELAARMGVTLEASAQAASDRVASDSQDQPA